MRESPRTRRLRSDYKALQQLRSESSILDFTVPGAAFGGAPEVYLVKFHGKGVWRTDDKKEVRVSDYHEVQIKLGASYPRMIPELSWKTPIFHPNISASGVVCLGGYGTHWVPSLQLDELCTMLWDMIRYRNFDVDSPYNREAANWVKSNSKIGLPLDSRSIRDRLSSEIPALRPEDDVAARRVDPPHTGNVVALAEVVPVEEPQPEVLFLSDVEIVEAEIVERADSDILYIE